VSEPTKSAPTATPRWATTVVIPTTWTPEQALAVFELIDDLREKLWALYGRQIQNTLRQEQGSAASIVHNADPISDNSAF
jgi:hypothetical protein